MTSTTSPASYPVRLTGELDANLSRWLWLVKMFLAIPHCVVLAFLWVAFLVTTVIAGFAILFTGRYPRSLFDFNVGVLRWNWRVGFYVYAALGTDRYPPFTLGRTDYPADFDVGYPEHLSRGLVLVKWLLAIPHRSSSSSSLATSFIPVDHQHRLELRVPARRRILSPQPARRHSGFLPVDHRAVPPGPLRPAHRHQPLALPRPHLRRLDARRIPAIPSRSGHVRARQCGRARHHTSTPA
jgi:hypothetical protein